MLPTVYFDGACHLCSREIEHYRKKDVQMRFAFVDIADPHFDAVKAGLDPIAVNRKMHFRDGDGKLYVGVDAFVRMWQLMPGYAGLAKVAAWPVVNPLLWVGYHAFARLRPYLPKRRRADCDTGTCHR